VQYFQNEPVGVQLLCISVCYQVISSLVIHITAGVLFQTMPRVCQMLVAG